MTNVLKRSSYVHKLFFSGREGAGRDIRVPFKSSKQGEDITPFSKTITKVSSQADKGVSRALLKKLHVREHRCLLFRRDTTRSH